MNQDYSNRELDEKFHGIHEKLDLILHQTTKTNGRVTSLEQWKWTQAGAIAILTTLVIPILFKIL